MVEYVFFVTHPEVFAKEIAHIKSLLMMYNTRSMVIDDSDRFLYLIPQLSKQKSIIILFATSNEELEDLISFREHLGAIPTILVLPDDNTRTLQKGMLLSPMYFMAKNSEVNQFSLAIDELHHIYEDYFHDTRSSSVRSRRPGRSQ